MNTKLEVNKFTNHHFLKIIQMIFTAAPCNFEKPGCKVDSRINACFKRMHPVLRLNCILSLVRQLIYSIICKVNEFSRCLVYLNNFVAQD